jgi:hypothetical protein
MVALLNTAAVANGTIGACSAQIEIGSVNLTQSQITNWLGVTVTSNNLNGLFGILVTGAKVWAAAHFSLAPIRWRGFFGLGAAVAHPFRVKPFRA